MSYVALHNHTVWSLLDGMCRVEDMVIKAKELGMNALAITDHGTMHGTIEFYKTCLKHGIKPIIGCEVYVTGDRTLKDKKVLDKLVAEDRDWLAYKTQRRRKKAARKKKGSEKQTPEYELVDVWSNCHLVLLASTQEGYENLLHIVSDAQITGFYYKPLTDISVLRRYGKGIIALSACLGGEIPSLIMNGDLDRAKAKAREYSEIFDEFYLEIQPGSTPEQVMVNETLIEMSKELGIPLVCTSDTHYLTQDDAEVHDALLAVQTGKKVGDEDRMRFPEMIYWLKSEQDMIADSMPQEAIENTQRIADKCNVTIPLGNLLIPEIDVPKGYTTDTYLSKLAYDGLFDYALTEPIDFDKYKARLEYELSVIYQKELSGYFLIVRDFIKWANDRGIITGPGRGSAAGSLISFLIGITKLDPLKYELLFERFINPERASYPDVDVDIEYSRRHEVIEYVTQKYGSDCVCQIGTFGTMAAKAVLKDVARALDIPFDIVNRLTDYIPIDAGSPWPLEHCIHGDEKKGRHPIPELVEAYNTYPKLFKVAMALEDNPRHSSTHASGVVISPVPVEKVFPLMTDEEGGVASQYDMVTLEELGVIKFDFLGLRTLSVIQDTVNLIKERHNVDIDIDNLPLDDEATYKLLSNGETDGVFQVESGGMKQLLRELKPRDFSAIIAAIALYRPGPMQYIPAYVSAYNGFTEPQYLIPGFKDILKETYGIIVYQEQVMLIAQRFAGYTPGQADMLRKGMGKKIEAVMNAEIQKLIYGYDPSQDPKAKPGDKPIAGLVAKGMDEAMAIKFGEDIKEFAKYAFNKSHSAGYAILCYQTAWLKAHYPFEFMASLITSVYDSKDKVLKYMEECKRLGMKILPPDINLSSDRFTLEQDNALRYCLCSISGVGRINVDALLSKKPFSSIKDMVERLEKKEANKKVFNALTLSGALDNLAQNEGREFKNRLDILQYIYELRGDKEQLDVDQFTTQQELEVESELLGMYLSRHPLDGLAEPIVWESVYYNIVFDVTCIVLDFRVIKTKKGDPMAFVDVETLEGKKNFVVFPAAYNKVGNKLKKDTILTFSVKKKYGGTEDSYIVENIKNIKKK